MTQNHDENADPAGTAASGWNATSAALNDDDIDLFRVWRDNLVFHDPRYHNKELMAVARRAMTDSDFRERLVNDTEAVLSELPPGFKLPEVANLRFFENTPDTLNVVLPPKAGEASGRSVAFRDVLKSRTAASPGINASASFLRDDFDVNALGGDPDLRDFLLITVTTS